MLSAGRVASDESATDAPASAGEGGKSFRTNRPTQCSLGWPQHNDVAKLVHRLILAACPSGSSQMRCAWGQVSIAMKSQLPKRALHKLYMCMCSDLVERYCKSDLLVQGHHGLRQAVGLHCYCSTPNTEHPELSRVPCFCVSLSLTLCMQLYKSNA